MSKPIVILDTNILLDILVFDEELAHPLREALEMKSVDAVSTPRMVAEFLDVIARPQFELSVGAQKEIATQWGLWCRMVDDESLQLAPWKCRDRDDQVFINLSYSLRPATLISKDKQVLKLAKRAFKEQVVITSDHSRFI
jgi:putative PIN family toxin of toxin-antitoxin system